MHRGRIQRQRGDRVHGRHDLAVGVAAVEGLHVALAHVAAVEAIAVAGGERGDARAIRVEAERARELMEAPARGAARADQEPLGRRCDLGEIRFAAAQRAVPASQRAIVAMIASAQRDRNGRIAWRGRLEPGNLGVEAGGARPRRFEPVPDRRRQPSASRVSASTRR